MNSSDEWVFQQSTSPFAVPWQENHIWIDCSGSMKKMLQAYLKPWCLSYNSKLLSCRFDQKLVFFSYLYVCTNSRDMRIMWFVWHWRSTLHRAFSSCTYKESIVCLYGKLSFRNAPCAPHSTILHGCCDYYRVYKGDATPYLLHPHFFR